MAASRSARLLPPAANVSQIKNPMCLAIPGKVESIRGDDPLTRMGKVNFGGILKDACLAYVPEARVGDYVIVHVGFALSRLDETEAHKVLEHLTRIGELADLEVDGS